MKTRELIAGSDITDLNAELFFRFLKLDNKKVYDELKEGKLQPNIEFINDAEKEEFRCIVPRGACERTN